MKSNAILTSIRESSEDELVARIKRVEEELFQHKLKRQTNQLENTNLIDKARKEIARCKTILSARKHGKETAQEKTAAAEGDK